VLVASGAPILVEGRLWGVVIAALTRLDPAPREPLALMPDAEGRMMAFTELVATAIASAQGRADLRTVADEQAALRRVATLVARAAPPAEVFTAVAAEVARIVPEADATFVGRYDSDAIEVVGGWSASGDTSFVGSSARLGGRNVSTLVFETAKPARVEQLADDDAAQATMLARRWARSSAGAPINVHGRVWGVVSVASRYRNGLPAGIEHELAGFTGLVATAVVGAQSRAELEASRAESRRAAEEQAALRRVATLVARGVPAAEIFDAVVSETRRVLDVDACGLVRVESDGSVRLIAADSGLPGPRDLDRSATFALDRVIREVVRTGRPARKEFGQGAAGPGAERARHMGIRCLMGAPVAVEGRLWGIIGAAWAVGRAVAPGAELRLEQFTELVATAVANAQSRADLEASRARVVEAADDARRRIERDLHDGVQQRLVTLGLQARAAEGMAGASAELLEQLSKIADGLNGAFDELREISVGIHPPILARGGLRPAIRALARRSPVPVRAAVPDGLQLPERVEVAAYYVASEALTNVAKHARASRVDISAATNEGCLELTIHDDGVGGARRGEGTGLVGLADRVEALGGTLRITSPPDQGTTLQVTLPCGAPSGRGFDRA
jgi:signal transduction histidine kinase